MTSEQMKELSLKINLMHLFGYHICIHSLYYQHFKFSILFPSEVNVSSTADCRIQMVEALVGKYLYRYVWCRVGLAHLPLPNKRHHIQHT